MAGIPRCNKRISTNFHQHLILVHHHKQNQTTHRIRPRKEKSSFHPQQQADSNGTRFIATNNIQQHTKYETKETIKKRKNNNKTRVRYQIVTSLRVRTAKLERVVLVGVGCAHERHDEDDVTSRFVVGLRLTDYGQIGGRVSRVDGVRGGGGAVAVIRSSRTTWVLLVPTQTARFCLCGTECIR